VSQIRELRRIFRPKIEEVTGRRREMYNQELHQVFVGSSNEGGWDVLGHVACMAEMTDTFYLET
jgi:hypothetical protein